MTPKERVKAVIAHQKPDRVPMGETEVDAPIIEAFIGHQTYYRAKFRLLKAYMEGRRDEAVSSMKRDYVDFIRKAEHDIAVVFLVPDKDTVFYPLKQISPSEYADENDNVFRYSEETQELMFTREGGGPLKLMSGSETSEAEHVPTESELELVTYVMQELGDTHFIIAHPGLVPYLPHRKTDHFKDLLDGIIDRPLEYRNQRIAQARHMRRIAEFFKRQGCDAVMKWMDVGHNQGTIMSPKCFRDILFPGLKAEVENAHAEGLALVLHSCGNNREIWHDFAESGIDVYQAIQDEEPLEDLKREVGNAFTFWGGVSCRSLDAGTPGQIRQQTERSMEFAKRMGGLILGSSHSLGVGVKLENYLAMLEVWTKYR